MKDFLNSLLLISLLMVTPVWADDFDEIDSVESSYSGGYANPVHEPKVYRLYGEVELTSKKDISYAKPRIVVRSVYPVLMSLNEHDGVDFFNEWVSGFINEQKKTFIERVNRFRADANTVAEGRNDLYIDFNTSFLRSNKHHLISIRFSVQGYIAGMAHPYHYHRVLNYDLDHAQVLFLNDLFKEDTEYLPVIADYAHKVLAEKLTNQQMIVAGTAPTVENFKNWNIKPNGLLITFDESQVAPAVDGAQTVLIPYTELKPLIVSTSPIAGCVKNKNACRYSNILTGGFIDEAINVDHRRLNPILSQLQ